MSLNSVTAPADALTRGQKAAQTRARNRAAMDAANQAALEKKLG